MLQPVGLLNRFRTGSVEGTARSFLPQFLKRTKAAKKVRNLLMQAPWNSGTLDALQKSNVHFSGFVVSEVLSWPTPIDNALKFFNWWRTQECYKPSAYVYSVILARLGKDELYNEMDSLLDACKTDAKLNVFILTNVITRHKRTGNIKGALQVWNQMQQLGIKPNTVVYTTMIDFFAQEKQFKQAGEYYMQMVQEERFPNVNTCTVLMYHLVQAGQLDAARMIMNEMSKVRIKPNPVTYSILIRGYAKTENMEMILELAREMREYGIRPSLLGKEFYKLLKDSLGTVEDAEKVIEKLCYQLPAEEQKAKLLEFQTAVDLDTESEGEGSPVSAGDARSSDVSLVHWNRSAFANALNPWTPSTAAVLKRARVNWNGKLVLDILKRLRDVGVAWRFFDWIERQPGYKHDYYTYTRMIHMLLGARNLASVKRLVEGAQQRGVILSISTYNRIIKCYGLAKDLYGVTDMLDHLKGVGLKPNTSTFANLIHALTKSKCCQSTKRMLLRMMQDGFKPDVKVFNTLIFSFGVAGEVEMVHWLLRSMFVQKHETSLC